MKGSGGMMLKNSFKIFGRKGYINEEYLHWKHDVYEMDIIVSCEGIARKGKRKDQKKNTEEWHKEKG